MNNKKFKLNRWAYGFAALALILGCLLTMMSFYQTFPNIPGELEERVTLDNLTQLIIPGSLISPSPSLVHTQSTTSIAYTKRYLGITDSNLQAGSQRLNL
jgi:hypothetical protein